MPLKRLHACVLSTALAFSPCRAWAVGGTIGEIRLQTGGGQALPLGPGGDATTTLEEPQTTTQPQAPVLSDPILAPGAQAIQPDPRGQPRLQEPLAVGGGAARIAPPALEATAVAGAPVQPAPGAAIGASKAPDGDHAHMEAGGPPTATEILGVQGQGQDGPGPAGLAGPSGAQPRVVRNPEGSYDGNTRRVEDDPAPTPVTDTRDAAGPARPQLSVWQGRSLELAQPKEAPQASQAPPLLAHAKGLPWLDPEARTFINGWFRVSMGFGLGLFPTYYDSQVGDSLRRIIGLLETGAPANAYNRFSNLLASFIIDVVDPRSPLSRSRQDIPARVEAIVAALREIQTPLLYVNASANLFEAFGKLGLGPSLLVNERRDLVAEALRKVEQIDPSENTASGQGRTANRGNYDRVISYARLFIALGHLGVKERLLEKAGEKGNYVETALSHVDSITSPFARGRYAPMLFSVLKVLGYDGYLYRNPAGKDYVADLLDFMDDDKAWAVDAPLGKIVYRKAYPMMISLGTIGVLGQKKYLTYKKDRLAEAREILPQLRDPDSIAKHVALHLVALSNSGELESQVPDMDAYLRGWLPTLFETKEPKFLGYAFELLYVAGRQGLIPKDLLAKWIGLLNVPYSQHNPTDREPPYTAAFMLTVAGELGLQDRLLKPDESFGGDAPFFKFLRDFLAHEKPVAQFLPMINHAILNYALRMRGKGWRAPRSALEPQETPSAPPAASGPVFLAPGRTIEEQERYLAQVFAATPLGRDGPQGKRLVTGARINRAKSGKGTLWIDLDTSLGAQINISIGSRVPDAPSPMVTDFKVGFGPRNDMRKQFQQAYPHGEISTDILLILLKLLKDNGAAGIREKLGTPGGAAFFEKALGTSLRGYYLRSGEPPYRITDTGFSIEAAPGRWVDVKDLSLDLGRMHFPAQLWPPAREPSLGALAQEMLPALGLAGELRPGAVRLVDTPLPEPVRELDAAVDRWVAARGGHVGAGRAFSETELVELVESLGREHRAAVEAVTRDFSDLKKFPGRPWVGLPAKRGHPTVFILGWRPGQATSIHDHGDSLAAYHDFQGDIYERKFVRRSATDFEETRAVFHPGQTMPAGRNHIHQVGGALESGVAASIHAYAPELVSMFRYDLVGGRMERTTLWEDDEVVQMVSVSRGKEGPAVAFEQRGLDDWALYENDFPGYTRNAVAVSLLFAVLESKGLPREELIRKGYSLHALNRLYERSGLSSAAVFRLIQFAARQALESLGQGRPLPRVFRGPGPSDRSKGPY